MADPDDISETTRAVLADLDPGTAIGDKVILSKQQVAAVVSGGATLTGVLAYGSYSVAAQDDTAKLGTEDDPTDADLANYGSEETSDGYEFTIEGDTFEVLE